MNEEVCKNLVYNGTKNVFVGFNTGLAMIGVGYPFDTIKVKLQVQDQNKKLYTGFMDAVVKTMKHEGVRGFYIGSTAPLVGQFMVRTTIFGAYQNFHDYTVGKKKISYNSDKMAFLELSYVAGMFSGLVTTTVDTPVDMCKSKLQAQNKSSPEKFTGAFDCFKKCLKNHGIRGVYQGYTSLLIRNIWGYSAYFLLYELLKNELINNCNTKQNHFMNSLIYMLSGGLAGVFYWVIAYNIDVVKSAMMADHSYKNQRKYKNSLDCVRKLYLNEGGYKRFWKGFTPCLLRSAPTNAAMFIVVEYSRKIFPAYETLF